ncbi:MAG: hypothetical protein CMC88_02080 [Flavobacteriaceae bacterium]|nr:hypothetical protein [Flavobacteriaceae bacterium]|tara:strand:- start:14082 stop:14315 length:234 start_codon:yes stop_codon:yes gene_type:complete
MSQKKILFGKINYIFLIISLTIIGIGFLLMSGGGSEDPNIFNPEIFNDRRIKLAPTIVIFGFILAIFSILVQKNNSK